MVSVTLLDHPRRPRSRLLGREEINRAKKICDATFLCPIYFLSPQLTAPGSPRMPLDVPGPSSLDPLTFFSKLGFSYVNKASDLFPVLFSVGFSSTPELGQLWIQQVCCTGNSQRMSCFRFSSNLLHMFGNIPFVVLIPTGPLSKANLRIKKNQFQ